MPTRSTSPDLIENSAAGGTRNSNEAKPNAVPSDASRADSALGGEPRKASWTFLTNHSHVLILLSQDSSMILRDVAVRVGITERAVQRIIADLEEAGYIERHKVGRQNQYRILAKRELRHPIESHRTIGDLIDLVSVKR